jgi:hypothetical protein
VINGFTPDRHQRFQADGTPNPGFLLPESQLSGVAFGQGVLITSRHYVAAAHVSSPSVTFRGSDGVLRTYSAAESRVLSTAVPGEGDAASDIRVYTLAEEVDPAITPLPLAVGPASSFRGQIVYAFDHQGRAGRNVIDSVNLVEFSNGSGNTVTIRFGYDTAENGGSGGLGIDEIGLTGGDSGHQALIRVGDQWGVIGAHMGIDVPAGSSPFDGDRYDSFSTLLAAYEPELQSLVAADGYQLNRLVVTAIPEPRGWLVLGLLGVAVGLRRPDKARQVR